MLDVCLLGTGGMMPLPDRWLTSLFCRYCGKGLLIDCGEGTQISMRKLGWSFKQIDVLCITHFHGDHISGLPGILLAMANADRTEPLQIIGPKGIERVVNSLRVIAAELPFPIVFTELSGPECRMEICGFQLTAFRVQHNTVCYGYTLEIPRQGKFDPERARAQEIPLKLWNPLQKGQTMEWEGRIYTPDMVLGEDRKGLKLTYCTDSRPTASIAAHAAGADLFICEGMYGDPEKEASARAKKHMTMQEAAALGAKAEVREMWLTHYSPSVVRPEWYLKKLQKIFPKLEMGTDGKMTVLMFEEE